MKENEGKLSFTQKQPKNFKEAIDMVQAKLKSYNEKLAAGGKDETLLSSDDESKDNENENDDKNAMKSLNLKEINKIIGDDVLNEEETLKPNYSSSGEEEEKFSEEIKKEKKEFNKKLVDEFYQMQTNPSAEQEKVNKLNEKIKGGKITEEEIASEMKEFLDLKDESEIIKEWHKDEFNETNQQFTKEDRIREQKVKRFIDKFNKNKN